MASFEQIVSVQDQLLDQRLALLPTIIVALRETANTAIALASRTVETVEVLARAQIKTTEEVQRTQCLVAQLAELMRGHVEDGNAHAGRS